MGGMHNLGAMLHAGGRGSSNGPAVQRKSSLRASSATITNITKMSWTDFQKYASVFLFPGDQVPQIF